ncbi:methylation-associated defense system protein kinase MAD6 [Nocardia nova]|uniref:methylation-associated defense system protein kinase MAD6 n=1 Tax=Nocardia nova TaxID=37330 RepID=UPI0007A4D55A|nr:protein kinase [Nocardia nova]
MAEIVGGGPPVNDAERAVIGHLRDHGPADWWVLHNVEIPVHGGRYEIDVIVVTGHAVCLIDVKGTAGRIEVVGTDWYPQGRDKFGSPVSKLNGHARAFKGHLERLNSGLSRVYVDAMVVLSAPSAVLVDRNPAPNADAASVASLSTLIPMLQDVSRVRRGRLRDLTAVRSDLVAALTGSVQRPTGPRRFRHWVAQERLGGTDEVTEYRAVNATLARSTSTVLLRVYRVDPFQPTDRREAEKLAISNAYSMLTRMPPHECIVGRHDFFPTDDEDEYVLVLDDPRGKVLQLCLNDIREPLAADVKVRVFADILAGLAWAHQHRVLHRALSPTSVLVKSNGRATITGFDYARPEEPRPFTVLPRLQNVLDAAYVAPECQGRAQQMSRASDVYAAGVIAYQLFTAELPFTTTVEQFEKGSVLPTRVLANAGVSADLADLMQRLCALAPSNRPTAAQALDELGRILGGRKRGRRQIPPVAERSDSTSDFRNLTEGDQLTTQHTIRRKLGAGTFGVVYQAYDNLAGTDRVVKIIDRDPESAAERLRQEYQILLRLPSHPNVVKVDSAGYLDNGTVPYLVFEYLDGRDLRDLLGDGPLNPADALRVGRDLAAGLAFLHDSGVYHCDIKPSNVLRTDHGCKILDFNVAVTSESSMSRTGGNHRYRPPDNADGAQLDATRLIDRDVYGAGLILYETLTGHWPFDSHSRPVLAELPYDPRRFDGLADLSDEFVAVVRKAIMPLRGDRFASAEEFRTALESIGAIRRPRSAPIPDRLLRIPTEPEGTNPFVAHLQTLYSQSRTSNAGTRGQDPRHLYVATLLDTRLTEDVLAGTYRLVIITGNAGDGKTAFLEELTARAIREFGGKRGPQRSNGAEVDLPNGWRLRTNHDGSQDEGSRDNDEVLLDFFAPYADDGEPYDRETRLIAINEGRLVDFCTTHADQFTAFARAVGDGLDGQSPEGGIAVINLNRRSLVARDNDEPSIFQRILTAFTAEKHWAACTSCELSTTCYARHNAATLGHPTAGAKVAGRLEELYTLTHLRGHLHMTLRDIRSALAFTLTSGRNCTQIRDLYRSGDADQILDGFYFTSWTGPGSEDRLLIQLRQLDVAKVPEPALDRKLDYVGPDAGQALMDIDGRDNPDLEYLNALFRQLTRAPKPGPAQTAPHARYLAAARRRFYFECVDEHRARGLLPYHSASAFLELLTSPARAEAYLPDIIEAVNRGEGLPDPRRLGDDLALQVRHIPGGTIRSYRLFSRDNLTLSLTGSNQRNYVETQFDGLILQHRADNSHVARLRITLDLFELLFRLRRGFLPGVADEQGVLLGLTIFKNELAAAPYQEILLTSGGEDLHQIERTRDGRLRMRRPTEEVNQWRSSGPTASSVTLR